jgi:hypothetical protein
MSLEKYFSDELDGVDEFPKNAGFAAICTGLIAMRDVVDEQLGRSAGSLDFGMLFGVTLLASAAANAVDKWMELPPQESNFRGR